MLIEASVTPVRGDLVTGSAWAPPVLIAHCCDSGVIEIGAVLPEGHIELASGPITDLHERLLEHARKVEHQGRMQFLVPGMPEAADVFTGQIAARCWVDWCAAREDGAVVWANVKVTP